jgi:hypothetical protein
MFKKSYLFVFTLLMLLSTTVMAQVLGPCGTKPKDGKAPAPPTTVVSVNSTVTGEMTVKPIPLPGQQAIDFELPAVVGKEIKNIKLSDYSGKWRILCFYPADFTFV